NGLQEAQVRAIMATQVARAERLAQADDVIVNDDGLEALAPQIERLHRLYMELAEKMATIPSERL
ncbi:MAG TPA: dephospho-CoA kinase, partial [Telluria sp.]